MNQKALLASAISLLLVGHVWSATILMDSSTLNGSFESGTDGVPSLWQTGFGITQVYREAGTSPAEPHGDYVLFFGENGGQTNFVGGALNTGYNVQTGDTFDISFYWAKAGAWTSNDSFNWRLFTTSDDTVGGAVTIIASGTPTGNPTSYVFVTNNGAPMAASNLGRDLWISFDTIGRTSVVDNDYVKVDNVVLSVTSVPEASTAILVLVATGLTLASRRRG